MNNKDEIFKDIETPSSLTEEDIKYIRQKAEEWKNAKVNTGIRNGITSEVKAKYKENKEAIEYFHKLKYGKKNTSKPFKKRTPLNEEAIAREFFSTKLSECIKDNFYKNSNIDINDGIFLLDENYNLPSYFWMRMYKNVLPIVKKQGCTELRAWKLAAGIIDHHKDELNSRLRNTKFSDLQHVSHSVIQFLNKYMATTYKELVEKNRQVLLHQKKLEAENEITKQQQNLWDFLESFEK